MCNVPSFVSVVCASHFVEGPSTWDSSGTVTCSVENWLSRSRALELWPIFWAAYANYILSITKLLSSQLMSTVTVFGAAREAWYVPGFYGRRFTDGSPVVDVLFWRCCGAGGLSIYTMLFTVSWWICLTFRSKLSLCVRRALLDLFPTWRTGCSSRSNSTTMTRWDGALQNSLFIGLALDSMSESCSLRLDMRLNMVAAANLWFAYFTHRSMTGRLFQDTFGIHPSFADVLYYNTATWRPVFAGTTLIDHLVRGIIKPFWLA